MPILQYEIYILGCRGDIALPLVFLRFVLPKRQSRNAATYLGSSTQTVSQYSPVLDFFIALRALAASELVTKLLPRLLSYLLRAR